MSDIYNIIKVPDPILKQHAAPVENTGDAVKTQVDRMVRTMYEANGIGLAAPQVGILNRIFVMDVPSNAWKYDGTDRDGVKIVASNYRSGDGEHKEAVGENKIVMINPEIVQQSDEQSLFQEGCLSIPQQFADIVRPARVTVAYIDREGKQQEQSFEGLPAHCVQHEIDHLNGVLFIDYISSLKRNMMIKRVQKLVKQNVL
jgi:peptide deformylase